MARWTYLIADLRTNTIAGELPLTNVRWSKVLNGAGQLSADLNLGDPRLADLPVLAMTRPAIRVVYALRDNTPLWGGILWAADYDSDNLTVSMVAADFFSYFDHRKLLEVLPSPPIAVTYLAGLSKVYTATDQNAIARDLVALAQTHTGGDIGVLPASSANSGILLDRTYHGYEQWYVGEALRELARLSDGPDICFDVSGPDSSGRPLRVMRLGTPRLTQSGVSHRWDLGGNLLSFAYRSGGGAMSTRVFYEGGGAERGARTAVAEDATLYADGWPLLETDRIDATITDDVVLQEKADTLLESARLPTVSVELRVRADLPPVLGEYAPGDEGRVVIGEGVDPMFPEGLDVSVRIGSMEVGVDVRGRESVTLHCGVLGQEVA